MSVNSKSKQRSSVNSKTGGSQQQRASLNNSQNSKKRRSSAKSNESGKRTKSKDFGLTAIEEDEIFNQNYNTTGGSFYDTSTVQRELEWGLTYRDVKSKTANKKPLRPQRSPINIPFKICRYLEAGNVRKTCSEKTFPKTEIAECQCNKSEGSVKNHSLEETDPTNISAILQSLPPFQVCNKKKHKKHKSCKKKLKTKAKKANLTDEQLQLSRTCQSLLDRSALPQPQYMSLLAIPREYAVKERARLRRKCGCKCQVEPCSPRLVQMAIPKKRHVWDTWKKFQDFLPADILVRFDQILRSGNNNLEPREARYYFKRIDKEKRKKLRKKKLAKKRKKLQEKRGREQWLKDEIRLLVDLIVNYLKHMPLFALNYEQMLISNEILQFLSHQKIIKKVGRTNKKCHIGSDV